MPVLERVALVVQIGVQACGQHHRESTTFLVVGAGVGVGLFADCGADRPGLLAEACREARFGRLFLAVLADGTQVAIAPVGIEEVRMVDDLVDAVTVLVPLAVDPAAPPMAPTLLALNVGITRVLDDGFTGMGLERARNLANDAAVRDQAGIVNNGYRRIAVRNIEKLRAVAFP